MCTYQYAAFHPFLFTLHFCYLLFIFSIPFFNPSSSLSLPSWCTSHQTWKETKAASLSWSWEELSVPTALFDDSISNDTLIPTPHCLFFPLWWNSAREACNRAHHSNVAQTLRARLVPRNHPWQFCLSASAYRTQQGRWCRNRRTERDHAFTPQITLRWGDAKAQSKLSRINKSNEVDLPELSVVSDLVGAEAQTPASQLKEEDECICRRNYK